MSVICFSYTSSASPLNALLLCVVAAVNELVLIGLHAKPTDAVNEMEALVDVHTAVQLHWDTDNILIMGDLNAECSYASQTELSNLNLRDDPPFDWLIGDEVDTTTSSTDCAYDRCALRSFRPTIANPDSSGRPQTRGQNVVTICRFWL